MEKLDWQAALGDAWTLFKSAWKPLVILGSISTLVGVLVAIADAATGYSISTVATAVTFPLGTLVGAASFWLAYERYTKGKTLGVSESLNAVMPRFGRVLGANLLYLFGMGVGLVLCLVPGIFVMVVYVLGVPFVLIKDLKVMEALEASKKATEGTRMEIFLALLIPGLMMLVPVILVMCVVGGAMGGMMYAQGGAVDPESVMSPWFGVVVAMLVAPITILTVAISQCVAAVLCKKLIDRQGGNVAELAQVFE